MRMGYMRVCVCVQKGYIHVFTAKASSTIYIHPYTYILYLSFYTKITTLHTDRSIGTTAHPQSRSYLTLGYNIVTLRREIAYKRRSSSFLFLIS